MKELAEPVEVSFFDLAKRYEMARSRPKSWRDRRDTLPARRRRRRAHRRDRTPSRHYSPLIVDSQEANRGIRTRLLGSMGAACLTLICLLAVFLAPQFTLATTFALSVAVGSLGLSMALALSARREEIVHQMASELTSEISEEQKKALPPGSHDGWIGSLEQQHRLEDEAWQWRGRHH